ncbi:PGF-pre-PGF domain-containing protein [Methanosarcina sp. Mfa9]|uniref:PGF-pre-PGF domain-containing protein n=1 Tax=Methanosarcina sp. Mfa9 TaxID=3439063 RepID=UPI003F83932A
MYGKSLQNNTLRLSLIILIFVSLSTIFTGTALAETIVSISPETQSVEENQDFILSIYIEPDAPISGAQFNLIFDESLVNVREIREGDLFKQKGTTMFSQGTIDNSQGTVTGVYGLVLGKNMVTAPGTFATVYLSSTDSSGICKLQLSNVVVSNSNGCSMPVTAISGTVKVGDVSTSPAETISGGGSGGGGGAGSPEPSENVKLKELSQCFITNGVRARYMFRGDINDIRYVEFDPKRSFGKTTAIIEMLKGKSALTSGEPEGQVYQHMNIWIGTDGISNPENIENGAVGFRVERVWADENEIDLTSINLNHFSNGKWDVLETCQTGEDDLYLYFEARTPGFSPFAITGQSSGTVQSTKSIAQDSNDMQGSNDALRSEATSKATQSPEREKEAPAGKKDYTAIIYVAVGIILFLPILMIFKRS